MKKILPFILLIILGACDKIEDPLKPPVFTCGDCDVTSADIFNSDPNVLIEEFTGHQCNNCPTAAAEAKRLIDENPGRVFTMGIHAGGFANTNADYPIDYTTEEGDELFAFANPAGVPVGMVNRTDYPTLHNKLFGKWAQATEDILQSGPAPIGMILEISVDTLTRELCFAVKFKANVDLTGVPLKWCAFITEGKIKSPQKMPNNSKNKDYIHEHVFRDAINPTFGSNFTDFTGALNETTCETRAYEISEDWVIENCELVVYVYEDHLAGGSGEILQVLAEHL